METTEFRIHWLSFTVHASSDDAIILYDNLFKDTFGPLVPIGNGGRGFKEIHKGFMEFKVYLHPINENAAYFHFEIPGEACDMLRWEYYFGLINYLQCNFPDKYSFKRVDLAFDHVPFAPLDVKEAIKAGLVRSLAKRETLIDTNADFQLRDDGEEGCSTVQFGSRSSERMIRVYNKRGFTRLEMETKDDRADAICKGLFVVQDTSCWFPLLIGHLRDFMDLDTTWWNEFISGQGRAYLTVSKPRVYELNRIIEWHTRQVMPSLSVLYDVLGEQNTKSMINRGRRQRNPKYEDLVRNQTFGKAPREGKGS